MWKNVLFLYLSADSGSGRSDETGAGEVYADIPADLLALVEPIVLEHGLELVDVEVQQGHP